MPLHDLRHRQAALLDLLMGIIAGVFAFVSVYRPELRELASPSAALAFSAAALTRATLHEQSAKHTGK